MQWMHECLRSLSFGTYSAPLSAAPQSPPSGSGSPWASKNVILIGSCLSLSFLSVQPCQDSSKNYHGDPTASNSSPTRLGVRLRWSEREMVLHPSPHWVPSILLSQGWRRTHKGSGAGSTAAYEWDEWLSYE